MFLKADQYAAGKFALDHGSLEKLAGTVFKETRDSSTADKRFQEKWAEMVRTDLQGTPAYRIRVAWEERRNPHYPDEVLVLEVAHLIMLHPRDPDKVVSVAVSTRRRLKQEPLSADAFASAFFLSMRLE